MSAPRMKLNAMWNVAEALTSSLVLFVLYKLILARLGISALGVWSLVLATTSLARIADLGAAGGLGRYIALSVAHGESDGRAMRYLETALIVNASFYGALSLAIYWPLRLALPLVTHGAAVNEAIALLPYAIASFALLNVTNVVTATLIGLHKSNQKSIVVMLGLVLQISVAASLLPYLGLRAVALAQVAQYLFVTLCGWQLAVRNIAGAWKFVLPRNLDRSALRELVGFGLRLQVLNLVAFPFEPITKFVFSSVGGLPALGLYELASRGFLQVRQVVVAPSQNLTPLFTAQNHEGAEMLSAGYRRASALMIAAATMAMGGLAVLSPLLSFVWLGKVEPLFVSYSAALAFGWFFNLASTPGYYLGIASGRLRWNITGAVITTGLAAGLGLLFGSLFGPLGIAVGAMTSIALGSGVTWIMNCRALALPFFPSAGDWRSVLSAVTRRRLLVAQWKGL